MGVSVEKQRPFGEKTSSPKDEVVVDWKSGLVIGLVGETEVSISSKRAWARFSSDIRDLCPETNWIFINSHELPNETLIHSLKGWLTQLVAVPEWPFPEEVIIVSESKNSKFRWRLTFRNHTGKIPFQEPPPGLTLSPFRNKALSGWLITENDSFETTKAGEA